MRSVRWLVSVLVVLGCVQKEASEKVDETYVKENKLSAEPTPKHVVNADLGGKVVYLGADLDRDAIAPGDKVKVTHYWKVVQPPGSEWRPFTHIIGDAANPSDWINADETKMRKNYPVSAWKAGDIIKDEQTIPLKKDWKSGTATIVVGFYKKGSSSEKDRLPVNSGPHDDKNRVIVAKMTVSASAAAPAPKPYVIHKATGPITIDGKADEPDWAKAESTGPFKLAQGGQKVDELGETTAKLLYDDKNLYVWVDVADTDVSSQYTKHDDPIWKEDAIEMFIDADKNGRGYIEVQVNPNNATFDNWWAGTRANGEDKSWESNMKTAVTVDGTLNDAKADKGWHAEIALPLEAVKGKDANMQVHIPPQVGDTWRLNLVRVEKPKDKGLTASSWADITISDFHAIDRLNLVAFGDDKGDITPAAASQPASMPASMPASSAAPKKPAAPAASTASSAKK